MAPTFQRLTVVCCQDGASRERFLDLGVPAARLCLTGSMKYDDAPLDRETADVARCRQLAGIQDEQMIWLAGSTAPGEEAMALRIYQRLSPRFPQLRLILVPRHRERFDEVAEEIARAGLVCRRRRAFTETTAAPAWDRQTVLLIDTIGELKAWWGTSQLALVGGSFGRRGGQNMLEPCGYGSAVAFGPSTRNFRDIVRSLKTAGGAVEVADEAELAAFVERGLSDRRWAETLGQAAQTLIRQHRGATERTIAALPLAPPALPAETARLDTQQTSTNQAGTDQADQPRAA
jgi:3-deoxy-D-manno-octulosonic-acid transferase